MSKLVKHFIAWNRWRKSSIDGRAFKIAVLFGLANAPSFEWQKIMSHWIGFKD